MKILILGANGFIGSHLIRRLLDIYDTDIYGLDLGFDRLEPFLNHPRFHFVEGDISISKEWVEYHVKKCDVCLPLVAIATPATYVKDPLRVFELDFEENLRIIRQCERYNTRVIFPSTSEVYGMCQDYTFNEERSNCVYGPISKERWIYASSKQLLDRVIWAMGQHGLLRFTIFRPFNWYGPGLDNVSDTKEGSARVIAEFLGRLIRREKLTIVGSGEQCRSFTYIDDGITALTSIIHNEDKCDGEILNIGYDQEYHSILELAQLMGEIFYSKWYGSRFDFREHIQFIDSDRYYGKGYQDISMRRPDCSKIRTLLNWEAKTCLKAGLIQTIAAYQSGNGEVSDLDSEKTLLSEEQS